MTHSGSPSRNPTVFINYRREDTQWVASFLYDKLTTRLGRDHVFMDIDSIPFGDDWEDQLRNRVSTCDAMLVLIGEKWMASKHKRRLNDPGDHLRQEIEAALAREETRVVPLLVDGAKLPRAEEMPEPLRPLLKCQSIEIPRAYFSEGVERLVDAIAEGGVSHHTGIEQMSGDDKEAVEKQPVTTKPLMGSLPLWAIALAVVVILAAGGFGVKTLVATGNTTTPTPVPTVPPTAQPTSIVPTANTSNPILFGPSNGSITQKTRSLEGKAAGVNVSSFQARVQFDNPVFVSSRWDYGFEFGVGKGNNEYRLWVDSTKTWYLGYGKKKLKHGAAPAFDTSAGATNDITVIVTQGRASLWINGTYTAIVNLSGHSQTGDVWAASGFTTNDISEARSVLYTNFTVFSATDAFYKADSILYRSATTGPATYRSFTSLRDAIVTSKFTVPQSVGKYDIGFNFRVASDTQYTVAVDSSGVIHCFVEHNVGSTSTFRFKSLCSGDTSKNLESTPGHKNLLQLYVLGNRATFFVNGKGSYGFPTTGWQNPGDVEAVANSMKGDASGPLPSIAKFEIWSLDS